MSSVENISEEQRLLIYRKEREPLAGYSLVVFKDGRVSEIREGVPLSAETEWLPRWLTGRPEPTYYAVAVNRAPVLSYVFSEPVDRTDGHSVTMVVILEYAAAEDEPGRVNLARLLRQDPLRMLRDEIRNVVGAKLADQTWAVLSSGANTPAQSAVDASLPELQAYAKELGLRIKKLRVRVRLPEEVAKRIHGLEEERLAAEAMKREEERKQSTVVATKQTSLISLEAEDEIKTRKLNLDIARGKLEAEAQRLRIDGELVEAGGDATKRALGSIQDIQDHREAVRSLPRPFAALRPSGAVDGDGGSAEVITNEKLLPCSAGLQHVLEEMLHQTGQPGLSTQEASRIRSLALHILAETLLGEDADSALLESYAARLRAAAAGACMKGEQLRFLTDVVANHESLRLRLL